MRVVSVFLSILSLAIAAYTISQSSFTAEQPEHPLFKHDELSDALRRLQETAAQSASDTVGDTERAYLDQEFQALRDEINKLNPAKEPQSADNEKITQLLWVKLLFSLVFGGCALFVVLSQRYDDDTRKWATSVLSLISGVWIGTAS